MADPIFDIEGPGVDVLPEVTAPLGYFIQGIAKDENEQVWYVSQVMPGGIQLPGEPAPVSANQRNINGDMAVSKVSTAGVVLGTMYLTTFGHGQTLGTEPVSVGFGQGGFGNNTFGGGGVYLWVETDAHMDGTGFGSGRKVARLPFVAGSVVSSTSPTLDVYDPIPGATRVFPSLSFDKTQLLLSWFDGTNRNYNVYNLSDFKARNFTPVSSVQQVGVQGTLQSCVLDQGFIYMLEGTAFDPVTNPAPGNTYTTVMNATTGEFVQRILNVQGETLLYREPEGSTVIASPTGNLLVNSFATRTASPRGMAFFGYARIPTGGDWLFTTPTIEETPFAWNNLMVRYRMPRGISVVEVEPGVYEQTRYDSYTNELGAVNLPQNPNQDTDFWPAQSAGLNYFRGGYEWRVSSQVRQDIIDSGAATEDNFISASGFGSGGFGQGGFGE